MMWVFGVIAAVISATFAVGFALLVYDEIRTIIEDHRAERYWKEQAPRIRKEQRNKRIAQLEQELGITDNRRNT